MSSAPRARRSVLWHLVALVLIPTVGLQVFAGLFTQNRWDDAIAAGRIGAAMRQVEQMEAVRSAILNEGLDAALRAGALRYGLSLDQVVEALSGDEDISTSTPDVRAATDRELADVVADPGTVELIERLRDALRAARGAVDGASADAGAGGDPARAIYEAFNDVYQAISDVQRTAIRRVVLGRYGEGSSDVLTAAAQIEAVTQLVAVGNQRAAGLQGLLMTPEPEHRRALIDQLRRDVVLYEAITASLPARLSPTLGESWRSFVDDPRVRRFDAFMLGIVGDDQRAAVAATTFALGPEATEAGRDLIHLTLGHADLLAASVDEGAAVAAADEAAAERRMRVAVSATVLMGLATIALVVVIGGTIRRRLRELADAAERLSAGRLEPISVRGPREIAVAGAALDDAVANFRRVALQAELLASGDLEDPALQEAAPGALGVAVHASVDRIVTAVREREQLRHELARQAAQDPLTGLPNRAEAHRLLDEALARALRYGTRVAVLFIDLDRFKQCNDTHGHAAGDHLLRTVAERMTTSVRPSDTVCRLGGDEFVIIMQPAGSRSRVVAVGERVLAAVTPPIRFGPVALAPAASVGVAISHGSGDADALLRAADDAMYRAKANGRGGVEIADEPFRGEAAAGPAGG